MMMMMTASHGQTTTGPLKKNRNKNQIRILIWLISSFLALNMQKLCSEFRKKYRGKFKTNLTFRKFACLQFENKIQFTEFED